MRRIYQIANKENSCLEPFRCFLYPSINSITLLNLCKRKANQTIPPNFSSYYIPPHQTIKTFHNRKIRLGYVSSDFGDHPLAHLILGIFELYDKNSFQVFCYSLSKSDSSIVKQ